MHLGEVAAGKESFIPLDKSSKKTDEKAAQARKENRIA